MTNGRIITTIGGKPPMLPDVIKLNMSSKTPKNKRNTVALFSQLFQKLQTVFPDVRKSLTTMSHTRFPHFLKCFINRRRSFHLLCSFHFKNSLEISSTPLGSHPPISPA